MSFEHVSIIALIFTLKGKVLIASHSISHQIIRPNVSLFIHSALCWFFYLLLRASMLPPVAFLMFLCHNTHPPFLIILQKICFLLLPHFIFLSFHFSLFFFRATFFIEYYYCCFFIICVLPISVTQAHDHFSFTSLPTSPINTLTCRLE